MIEKFLPRVHFDSYEDFKANYKVNLPENFNFAYDVVDAWAIKEPYRTAMVWCNDEAEERIFSFADMKYSTDLSFAALKTAPQVPPRLATS